MLDSFVVVKDVRGTHERAFLKLKAGVLLGSFVHALFCIFKENRFL
jgi:hypothetical protein